MIAGVADTHAALWHLFGEGSSNSQTKNRDLVDQRGKVVYLIERNRLPPSVYEELTHALADPEHVFAEAAFTVAIARAMRQVSRTEVPDMPDRIIAATAAYFEVPVISRDRRIRTAHFTTVW